ncbi:MAG: DUF551 domain-containing protein [Pseudomonas sp.]|nr:DUF551 domain-containing protein [Pseudomonas sp.]
MSKWIKCSERLPDIETPVWGFTANEYLSIFCLSDSGEGFEWANCYGSHYYDNGHWNCHEAAVDDLYDVVSWMPLPSQPESEQ